MQEFNGKPLFTLTEVLCRNVRQEKLWEQRPCSNVEIERNKGHFQINDKTNTDKLSLRVACAEQAC